MHTNQLISSLCGINVIYIGGSLLLKYYSIPIKKTGMWIGIINIGIGLTVSLSSWLILKWFQRKGFYDKYLKSENDFFHIKSLWHFIFNSMVLYWLSILSLSALHNLPLNFIQYVK